MQDLLVGCVDHLEALTHGPGVCKGEPRRLRHATSNSTQNLAGAFDLFPHEPHRWLRRRLEHARSQPPVGAVKPQLA